MRVLSRLAPALAAAVVSLAACGGANIGADSVAIGGAADTTAGMAAAPGTDMAMAAAALSPANVASLVGLTNGNEIASGELAREKATHADVATFARMMIDDHQAMQRSLDSLAKAKDVTPQPPPQAEALRQAHDEAVAMLRSTAKGDGFDRAYIGSQIQAHQKAVADLQMLAGATTDAEMRTLIEGAIPKVQAHLDRAQQIQTALGGS